MSHKTAIKMVDQVKKVRKMVQNVAILRLFLRIFLAILAINLIEIGYFGLPTVGNTENRSISYEIVFPEAIH